MYCMLGLLLLLFSFQLKLHVKLLLHRFQCHCSIYADYVVCVGH